MSNGEVDYEQRLKNLLSNLFQFEHAELDFGIYRIMNQKRDDIKNFIEQDLIEAVAEALEEYSSADKEALIQEIEELKARIRSTLGEESILPNGNVKPEFQGTPLAEEYEAKKLTVEHAEVSAEHKAEIFNHIYQYFTRYYQDGDFVTLRRRSKESKYAVPYNGEEVMLHWANKDQYYVKTGEYFNNYAFDVEDYRIVFRVVEADTEQNNNQGDKRFFILAPDDGNYVFNDGKKTLTIYFEFRDITSEEATELGKNQKKINEKINEIITEKIEQETLKNLLNQRDGDGTILSNNLLKYTTQNTADFFIHKDLESFFKGELDFYIKNEILNLDDLTSLQEGEFTRILARTQAMKKISLRIIEFLAQIENFQKKLWEKKKFVVSTDYCMTLDMVPDDFYEEILQNEEQVSEWNEIFNLEELEKEVNPLGYSSNGYTLDIEFLREHQCLVLDTRYFSQPFKDRLLATLEDIDSNIDGLLVKSENWQALNLFSNKFAGTINCIYADPPYNTGGDDFLYKDRFQHSSWLSMMADRVGIGVELLRDDGVIFISIDDNEVSNLNELLDLIIGKDQFISDLAIVNNYSGRSDRKNIATAHEHMIMYGLPQFEALGLPLPDEYRDQYTEEDEGGLYRRQGLRKRGSGARREDRPNLYYPFYYDPDTNTISLERIDGYVEILPRLSDGSDGRWRWGKDTVLARMDEIEVRLVSGRNEYDVFQKDYLARDGEERRAKAKSLWYENRYSSDFATTAYKKIMGSEPFKNPKSPELIKDIIAFSTSDNDVIIDYFAGSGTTGQSVIALNKEDENSNRKYILVDMGEYFDNIILPRMKRMMFCTEWDNGKPVSYDGLSHMIKYQYLEQYEDSLNNIEFVLPDGTTQKTLFDIEGYFLRYMLDFESRDSPCRLNIEMLANPFDYSMRIIENGKVKDNVKIDLVETFNYLIGLSIDRMKTFDNDGIYYKAVYGHKGNDNIIVIWRSTQDLDLDADKTFIEGSIINDVECDKLYVNCQCYVEGSLPIERFFKSAMGG